MGRPAEHIRDLIVLHFSEAGTDLFVIMVLIELRLNAQSAWARGRCGEPIKKGPPLRNAAAALHSGSWILPSAGGGDRIIRTLRRVKPAPAVAKEAA